MTNNNFEFKSYTPTPTDQYMLGIAKVKLYGKIVVNFKHVKTKDGSGSFFCTNNYTLTDAGGEKKYLSCFQLDSRDDEEILMEIIRDGVNRVMAQRSAIQNQAPQVQVYYPHGMAKQAGIPTNEIANAVMDVMSQQEQLPF